MADRSPARAPRSRLTLRIVAVWVVPSLAIATLTASLGWGLVHAAKQSTSVVGSRVPDLTVRSLDGDVISLRGLTGTPMVVNFWASWCVPCRQEAPVLAAAARSTAGRVEFIGVDMQDTDAAAHSYETDIQSPYPVGPAVQGSYHDFGVTAPPETFYIDRRGTVVSRIIGPVDKQRMDVYMSQIST